MAILTSCLPVTWGQEPQGHVTTALFQNPLYAGDYADPTILRNEIFVWRYSAGTSEQKQRQRIGWKWTEYENEAESAQGRGGTD